MATSLTKASEQVVNAMKARVSFRSGRLRNSIGYSIGAKPSRKVIVSKKFGGDGFLAAYIFAGARDDKKSAYYALMVEFGTKPHIITSKNKKSMSFGGKFFKEIFHPGARARPFFFPTWRAMAPRVTVELRKALRRAVRRK